MTARLSLLVFVLAPTIALSQAAWAQPIPLTPAPIVATPIPPPIPVVTAPAIMLPPPVTKALLPGDWQLEGAHYVWIPPETRLRPVQLRPLVLGENVWKDGPSYPDIDYLNDFNNDGEITELVQSLRVESINSHIDVIALQSCIAYVSFLKRRTTQICWYMVPDRDRNGHYLMLRCPRFNRTN